MNTSSKITSLICCCGTFLLSAHVNAANIVLHFDASFEGLATSNQQPFTTGVLKLGWFDPISDTAVQNHFATGSIAAVDSLFHVVATVTNLNSFGPGLPFQSINIWNAVDEASLNAYQGTIAGKQIYAWLMSDAGGSATISLEQAIVKSDAVFPQAQDNFLFSDYEATFGTDSFASGNSVVIGSNAPVILGSGVDLNGGSPQDGLGFANAGNVLQAVAYTPIPEPSSLLLLPMSILVMFGRRRRTPSIWGTAS